MKTLVALTFLVMFATSCGGGNTATTTKDPRNGTNSNTSAFEPPPTPGVNR